MPEEVSNIGKNKPEKLMTFIKTLEKSLSKALNREIIFDKTFEPMKQEDVPMTYASIDLIQEELGFRPKISIDEGLQSFADWYVTYYDRKPH